MWRVSHLVPNEEAPRPAGGAGRAPVWSVPEADGARRGIRPHARPFFGQPQRRAPNSPRVSPALLTLHRRLDQLFINLLNGLSSGLLLFMLSSGLTLIFSMMGVLNFAHASFYMLGPMWPMR